MTFAPHQPSPLTRTISPFKDPRPAPDAPSKTAQLWDEYERRAVENARRREGMQSTSHSQRASASDLQHRSPSSMASTRSSFDLKFRNKRQILAPDAVATCKTCTKPITCTSGICEPCKKTIILGRVTGESTPPLSPTARNFASTDLQLLHKKLSREKEKGAIKSPSPKRQSTCLVPSQLLEQPVRSSSLHPPVTQDLPIDASRTRKASLTDPNEPFLRLKISQTSYVQTASHPTTPTYPPTTPPSTSHSRSSTRRSSVTNTMSPLGPAVHIPTHPNARHNSVTPSEMSTLYRPSVSSPGYGFPHATSAWDDWDSDDEGEKAGLVGYLKKAGKSRKKERSDSKTSLETVDGRLSAARDEERKKSRDGRRSGDRDRESRAVKGRKKKRPSGFVRALSCGGCSDD